MKTEIKEIFTKELENFKIKRGVLRKCLEAVYPNGSRMPYKITAKISPLELKNSGIQKKLWDMFGIPSQIFYNLEQHIEEEDKKAS